MPTIPAILPSISPTSQGLQNVGVRAVDDAFGVGVYGADQRLGKQFESAGDEIFGRAIAIQQQINDANAKEADARYVERSSNLFVDYESKQGIDAVNARPKFLEDLKALREETRASLPNDASRRLFDASTRQNYARTVFATASHAAKAQRDYNTQAAGAERKANREAISVMPDDNEFFTDTVRKNIDSVRQEGRQKGLHPKVIEENVRKEFSDVLTDRTIALARKDPFKAWDMFAANKHMLTEADRDKIEKVVGEGRRSARAKIISDEVNFGLEENDKPLQARIDEALEKGKKYAKDDPLLDGEIRRKVATDFDLNRKIRKDDRDRDVNTIGQLVNRLTMDGTPVTDINQITSDPAGRAAWERMVAENPNAVKAFQKTFENNAKSTLKVRDQGERQKLLAMSENDPNEFVNQDIWNNPDLDPKSKEAMWKLQQQKKKEPDKNPKVQAAMGMLKPMLPRSIIEDTKGKYLQFQGAVMDAMADYQKEHKKPMPYDEIQKLGPRLLQEQFEDKNQPIGSGGTVFDWGWGGKRLYQVDVPAKMEKAIKQSLIDKGIEPDAKMIQREYVRYLLRDGGKKKADK